MIDWNQHHNHWWKITEGDACQLIWELIALSLKGDGRCSARPKWIDCRYNNNCQAAIVWCRQAPLPKTMGPMRHFVSLSLKTKHRRRTRNTLKNDDQLFFTHNPKKGIWMSVQAQDVSVLDIYHNVKRVSRDNDGYIINKPPV